MHGRKIVTILSAAFSSIGALASAQDAAPAASPLPIEIRADNRAPAPIHAFGGRALDFVLTLQAPLNTRTRVYADLVQTANGAVGATLQRDVPVSADLVFDGCTSMTVPCRLPALEVVRRPTPMLLRLRVDSKETTPGAQCVLPVTAYPAEEPGAWKKTLAGRLSQSGVRRIAVFGEGKGVRQFLRTRNVTFEDLGTEWPGDPDAGTLYIADWVHAPMTSRRPDEVRGTRWLIFTTAAAATPLPAGVYLRSDESGGEVCKVTLPGLFDDPENRPDRLETLEEIFRLALEPRAANPAENQP